MEIKVTRNASQNGCTIGTLEIDGNFECYTCEDVVREVEGRPVAEWKVDGKTAIPRGRYQVTVTFSPHFGKLLPLLGGVPGFSGVRIHSGNTAADTEGCILVGAQKRPDGIGFSRAAFDQLFGKIKFALSQNQQVWLEIA